MATLGGCGPSQSAIDGNPDTYWHSQWTAPVANAPHFITIRREDLAVFTLGAVSYLSQPKSASPDQDVRNGTALEIKIYVADVNDNAAFTQVYDEDMFADQAEVSETLEVGERLERRFTVSPGVTARYVRFEIVRGVVDSAGGPPQGYGHAAEINLYELVTPAS